MTENIQLINGDSLQAIKGYADNHFDIAIVDPPYGIGYAKRKSKTKDSKIQYTPKDWDNEVPTQDYFNQLFRVSKNQIIFGGNYFELPPSRCFIIWDKCQPEGLDQAMCEFAWCSFDKSAKIYKTSVQQMQFTRIHPTQKPVKLYKWLLSNYTSENDLILDTHLGSGSIAIACHELHRRLVGYEIDKEYYEAACKRFERETAQVALW